MPPTTQRTLESSYNANLHSVRVHTDTHGQELAQSLSARAVTYGNHIFLGPGERTSDTRLMAHETAHVLQQQAAPALHLWAPGESSNSYEHEAHQAADAVMRNESFNVQQRTSEPQTQRLGLSDALNFFADKANMIPGFRMFTIVIGMNPINGSSVDRSPGNIIKAIIEFLPGGGFVTQALESSGVFDKVGNWVAGQLKSLGMVGSSFKKGIDDFLKSLSWTDIFNLGGVWERAKAIFTGPITQLISFVKGLITGIIQFIKDAILKPIAKLAEGTEGYNLLKGILGKDPITGEAVPRTAETLLGPLLKMIGLGDVWQKMQQANAIPRAWAWFQSTMSQLIGFVSQIPGLFIAAFKALTIEDIILIPKAFAKLAGVFGGFIGKFVSWGVDAMFKLLEIVFDVVSPGAFGYIKKTGGALKAILKNPLPFVGNLVKAAKLGFMNFGGNFLTHLKKGLIDWLTGSLEGVYIPKALSLIEFGKMALSILGISWAQIRGKIVKVLGPNGELIMQGLETAFDVVKALVTGGPAAAWEVIKDKLTSLKDTVVQGIISFVTEAIVTKAIPKLIAMFIPGAGFISAIISIYDTVMVFVNKISKIIQVVTAFINSIVAIAAGNIGAAAAKVESILGGLLSLAISFLAGFVGLGKVTGKVMEVINKVRSVVDKAIDAAIAWIVAKAKALFARLFGKKDKKDQKDAKGGTAQKGFSLPKEGHTVTAKAQNGTLKVSIASSREGEILGMLTDATAEVSADTTRSADQKGQIFSDLSGARQMVLSMRQDWSSQPKQSQDFAPWAEIRLTTIVNILTHLGADGIKAFADFKGKPLDKRYLPAGYYVREKLYITGSGWSASRSAAITKGSSETLTDVNAVVTNRTTNPPVADAAWNRLVKGLRVPSGATKATITAAMVAGTQYDVDHVKALSIHWQTGGGNSTGDQDRWDLSKSTNLRYITQAANLARPKGSYIPYVGKAFTSVRAQGGATNAKTIDGQPFLDGPGGSPI